MSVGGGILAFVVLSLLVHMQLLKQAHPTDGIIIAHKKEGSSDEEVWYPIVSYTLSDEQEITFRSGVSASRIKEALPVSTTVDVLSDPEHPDGTIIHKSSVKRAPSLAGLFGIVILISRILLFVR